MQEKCFFKKNQMLENANKFFLLQNFCTRAGFFQSAGPKKVFENANGAAGAVPGAEDDALGERPQNEITLLLVLCPELRSMRSVSALKCSI